MMRTMNSITTHTYTMNRMVRSITRSTVRERTVRERTVRRVRLQHKRRLDRLLRSVKAMGCIGFNIRCNALYSARIKTVRSKNELSIMAELQK